MHEVLEQQTINLVIMDINLPGKNGLMLARELRETTEVALMFLTGRDNEIDKILGEEGKIQVECHFCGKKYDFGKEDFKNL